MAEMSNPVDVMGRELPYSQEAELAVIGSALTNPHSVAESVEILKPTDFYFPQNKEIFSVILDLFNENSAIDFITVSNKLSQSDKLEAVGGIAYLRNAATNVPTTRHVTYYSQIIKEKSVLRTLIKSAGDISDMAYGQNDKVERIVDQAEQLIFDVTSSNNKSDILPISEIFMGSYQELVENSLNQSGITGLPTGFDELNRRTGGFHGGDAKTPPAQPHPYARSVPDTLYRLLPHNTSDNAHTPAAKRRVMGKKPYNFHAAATRFDECNSRFYRIPGRNASYNGWSHPPPETAPFSPAKKRTSRRPHNPLPLRPEAFYNTGSEAESRKTTHC